MRTLLLCAVLSATAFAQGSIFPSKDQKKAARYLEPAAVNEEARAFLKTKMKSHAKEMKDLSVAVATVQPDEVKRLAQLIADEPRLDPAVGAAAKLPARFFELQDSQRKVAAELSAASGDVMALQEKYGQLVEQCVACHAAFKPKK